MKRFVTYVATGMLAGALAVPGLAMAQNGGSNGAAAGPVIITSGGAPTTDLPTGQYSAWDEFRSDHPEIQHALSRNPKLITNEDFLERHHALRDFLNKHGGFTEDFLEHPGNYVVPTHVRARRRHVEKRAERAENSKTTAAAANGNAEANANAGGMNAGAGAGANAAPNSAAAPSGVPAATGEAGAGNSGAGAPANAAPGGAGNAAGGSNPNP